MLARPSTIVKQKAPNQTEHDIVVSSILPPDLWPAACNVVCASLVLRPNAAICGLGMRQVRMCT